MALALVALPAAAAGSATVAASEYRSWKFKPSGLDGAGFQNVIAASPFRTPSGARPLLVGADIAGISATGRLLEQSSSGDIQYLWAGTATQGVKRSSDDGKTWQVVALSGQHVRSIHLDPGNPTCCTSPPPTPVSSSAGTPVVP